MGAVASRPRARGSSKKGKPAATPTTTVPAPGDVACGADIVLGSHVQGPPEAAPHRTGAYDEILVWLDYEFRKNDINRDGSLDYHEFMRWCKSLDLNLSTRETFQFFALADRDNDERIVWSEIEQDVPLILATIYKALPPSPADWCEMVLPDDSGLAWFNKRTSEVRRERPPEMDAPASPSSTAAVVAATAAAAAKETVLENTETLDALLTWLDWEFKKADFDKNGTLSREEVASFIQGLRLGLGPKEVERFCRLADFNGDGVVEWKEVLELTPLILQKLYSAIEPGPHDVCVIVDAQQRTHYLNKRTGATTATPPPGFVPPSSPGTTEAAASVVACGKGEEETTSAVAESPSVRGTGPASDSSNRMEGETGVAEAEAVAGGMVK